jgi:porin
MNRTTASLLCLCVVLAVVSARATAAPSPQVEPDTAQQQPPPSPPATTQGTLNPSDEGVVLPTAASASPGAPEGLTDSGETAFMDQDLMTGDWGGLRKTLENDGLKFTPIYYGEVFGNPTGGAGQGVIYDGLLDLNLDLDLDRMSEGTLSDLTLHVDADYIHGASLSGSFVGDFSNTSNIAGYNTLRLQNLWLQKQFWEKRIAVKVGNISVDGPNEYFQSSSASLFINGTFGAFTFIASNVPNAPVYPLASPGVQIQVQPLSNFYVMSGVYGLDNDSDPTTNNKNGTHFALRQNSGVLVMTEAGYLLNQSPNDRGLQGTYRIGSWLNTGNSSTFASRVDKDDGTGELHSAGANYGVYGVMDQQIYSKADQAISFFVRSGGAPSNTNFVDWYAEGGFNFTGFIPGRASDVAGLAVARSHVSRDFSDSEIAEGENPFTAETVVEATYKIQVAPWWTIQPDFQYIFTPGGEEGVVQDAVVLGLRTTVAF